MCIGNTATFLSIPFWDAVYPYVYREHNVDFAEQQPNNGLSLCV